MVTRKNRNDPSKYTLRRLQLVELQPDTRSWGTGQGIPFFENLWPECPWMTTFWNGTYPRTRPCLVPCDTDTLGRRTPSLDPKIRYFRTLRNIESDHNTFSVKDNFIPNWGGHRNILFRLQFSSWKFLEWLFDPNHWMKSVDFKFNDIVNPILPIYCPN